MDIVSKVGGGCKVVYIIIYVFTAFSSDSYGM